MLNKTGARQNTLAVLSIFAEIHSTHPIFLVSPTLGLPPRFIDELFGAGHESEVTFFSSSSGAPRLLAVSKMTPLNAVGFCQQVTLISPSL